MKRIAGFALVAAGVALLSSQDASSGELEMGWSCTYVEAGAPGAADNELRISASQFTELSLERRGSRIRVLNANERPTSCDGPQQATVTNLDAITTIWGGDQAYGPTIDLGGGDFAPGATAEPDGTSEVEMSITGGTEIAPNIVGSEGKDSLELGTLSNGSIGLNLNARQERGEGDVDVTMPPDGILGAQLLRGNDRLDASGGSLLPSSTAEVELYVRVGPNADRVLGGAQGGAIVGGPGRDRITGGLEAEKIGSGPGDDSISVRHGGKDAVECGKGVDAYAADAGDDLDHCEKRTGHGSR